jgi:hypothetical protein
LSARKVVERTPKKRKKRKKKKIKRKRKKRKNKKEKREKFRERSDHEKESAIGGYIFDACRLLE